MSTTNERADLPPRIHADATLLLRRPFAPLSAEYDGGDVDAPEALAVSALQRLESR